MLKGVEFTDRDDLKEANKRKMVNIIKSDRSGKDATQVVQEVLDKLLMAQRNDCKEMLKRLIKHNTEAHESAAKAGKELMAVLEYFPISAWLQVADATTRSLVYMQVPEVVEIVKEAQVVIDRKKPREGEMAIHKIVIEQNLPDMRNLKQEWGYGKNDIGKKTVAAIIYKYLKERMFPKAHVTTVYLAKKFASKSSTCYKYVVGMKYKGGASLGTSYKASEDWSARQQEEPDANEGAGSSGLTQEDLSKSKGAGKKTSKKRDTAEIRGDSSKPKKK